MANTHLITGFAGEEHIMSEDQGSFNASFFGTGQYVMEAGNQLDASITSNNNVRILDGDILMYGRHIRIKPNTYEDVNISTGSAGFDRNDLIVCEYAKNTNTGIETATIKVLIGTEAESSPSDPEYVNGNIIEGATLNQMPLYRVKVRGVVLSEVEQLFDTIPSYGALAEHYKDEFIEACETFLGSLNILDTKELIDANTQENQLAGALAVKEISTLLGNLQTALNTKTGSVSSTVYIGQQVIASDSSQKQISNAAFTANSLVDIYYAESSKETVQKAKPSYSLSDGYLNITFGSALTGTVTIEKIRVVNV